MIDNLSSSYLGSFFFVGIHDVGQEPTLTVAHLGFTLELLDRTLVHHTSDVHDTTTNGRFTGIDVTDEDDVHILTGIFLSDDFFHCHVGNLEYQQIAKIIITAEGVVSVVDSF